MKNTSNSTEPDERICHAHLIEKDTRFSFLSYGFESHA